MSFRTKFLSTTTLAIAISAFATFSFAQDTKNDAIPGDKAGKVKRDGRGFGRMGRHGGGDKMKGRHGGMHGLRGIDLTDAQKEQIRVIRENNKPDAAVLAEVKALRESRKAGTPITDAQKTRIKAIRDARRAKGDNVRAQMEAVLTADQRATIEKRKTEMKLKRDEFHQKRKEFRKNRPAKPAVVTDTTKIG
ncbi:MAG: Spy/CpxP family protein refolding chaperone [Pyrinomonadaceae bacterium]